MSNSIWKMPDVKPDIFKAHRILVIYEAHDEPELMSSTEYATLTANRYVNRWCYWDEFIAQADKAERLQKAVDLAVGALKKINETYEEEYYKGDDEHDSCDWLNCADDMDDLATDTIDGIKQLIKETTNDK